MCVCVCVFVCVQPDSICDICDESTLKIEMFLKSRFFIIESLISVEGNCFSKEIIPSHC